MSYDNLSIVSPVKRGGLLSFLVGTISNVLVILSVFADNVNLIHI